MKASEAKKLIGQEVWIKRNYDWRAIPCVILEVAGRNVRVDRLGSEDWYWLPDCRIYLEKPNYNPEHLG